MLTRCISVELMKLRRSRIWLILMILPIISVLIGSVNFYLNQGVLKYEWYSLWSQVSLFYGEFFLPILIAICCGYMWRLEHFNKNWNMIMAAPISAVWIFLSKLMVAGLLLIFVQGLLFLLYFLGGTLMGLSSKLPRELPGWLLRGWIAVITISALQLALSMRIRSYATTVGIGLCASFIGLGMYIANLGLFFPHSMMVVGMGVISQKSISPGDMIIFFIMNIIYIVAISTFAIRWIKKSDVIA